MNDDAVRMLSEKLDILISLGAMAVLAGKSQKEQIEALNRSGLSPKQISELIGTSSNTVSVTLSQLKKAKKGVRVSTL